MSSGPRSVRRDPHPPSAVEKVRRKPAAERREHILSEAAAFFADHGFQGTTRDLANRLGITQAALYKHFASKDEIIAALFDRSAERWRTENWCPALSDRSHPLELRLTELYAQYLSRMSGAGLRLFVRAGLDSLGQPARRGAMLTGTILEPVIEALRADCRLPGPSDKPILRGEREVAMALHGGLMFLAIRKHVYRMPMPDDLSDLIALQIRLWLPGAANEVRRLHRAGGEPEQLVPRPKRRT
jgi:AcrR family transcriptional regulator